ncbi:DMT family transporter [Sphingobacteriaceae bacterium WQ 2009]|uniref:DMT family transporter n=1 Tax=Rhinopithecimicrobium faecis TaxID=2820698 RepID=A0A8T4H7R5_9SPHI|nr:DMT family transporter [Sphingobacteriaceae bacterium WQ 2009]
MFNLNVNKNILILHFTVLVWGFTGVLGNLITIPALQLVWYRVLIAFLALGIYFLVTKQSIRVTRRQLLQILGVGVLVGIHWLLFFHAIKIATVSVALVTLSSLTLFTSILEPIINKHKVSKLELGVGLLIILGIYLIFKFEFQYKWGIICGLSCAFFASIFSICNAKMVKNCSPTLITFYEMIGAWIAVSIFMYFMNSYNSALILSQSNFYYLLILGVVCTAFAYVLGVAVMKELSAFTVALTTNLEPIYGIILAMLIFGQQEKMSLGFYLGASIVLGAVFLFPYIKTKLEQRKSKRLDKA